MITSATPSTQNTPFTPFQRGRTPSTNVASFQYTGQRLPKTESMAWTPARPTVSQQNPMTGPSTGTVSRPFFQQTPAVTPSYITEMSQWIQRLEETMQRDTRPTLAQIYASYHNLSSNDYTTMASLETRYPCLTQRQYISLPSSLLQAYDSVQTASFLGLFPALQRVYLTMDHRLYLWDYWQGDVCVYEQPNEDVIWSVALVKPLPGIFVDEVEFILVIVTDLEVQLLGVTRDASEKRQLHLIETPLQCPTDQVRLLSIVGTEHGRIFAGGSDGHLYEVQYRARDGWLTRQCSLMCHTAPLVQSWMPLFIKSFFHQSPLVKLVFDSQRHLIHALCKDHSLHSFHVTDSDVKHLGHVEQLASLARMKSGARENALFDAKQFSLVDLFVLEEAVAPQQLNVPGNSQNYSLVVVTSSGVRLYFSCGSASHPNCATLMHVRLPPDTSLLSGCVETSLSTSSSSSSSILHRPLPLAPNAAHPLHHQTHSCFVSDSLFMACSAFAEEQDFIVGCSQSGAIQSFWRDGMQRMPPASECASALLIGGRVWAIAEEKVVNPVVPVTSLNQASRQTLLTASSILVLTSTGLFILTRQNPLTILNEILSFSPIQETLLQESIQEWGAAEVSALCATLASLTSPSSLASSNAANVLLAMSSSSTAVAVDYSPRCLGLFLYLSRSVSSLWLKRVLDLSNEEYRVEKDLKKLIQFFERYPILTASSSAPSGNFQSSAETIVLQLMREFCQQFLESFSLIKLILQMNFNLPLMESVTWQRFLTAPGLKQELLELLLEESVSDDASRISIELLQETCPRLLSKERVVMHQSRQIMERVKHSHLAKSEKLALLNESVKLLLPLNKSVLISYLNGLCQLLAELKYYQGAIELCLACMDDPSSNPSPLILSLLDELESSCQSATEASFALEWQQTKEASLKVILSSSQEQAHFLLFEWLLLQRQDGAQLLQLGESNKQINVSLERFLSSQPSFADLLWKFYARQSRFMEAASLLLHLAMSLEISLEQRIEYLSRALNHTKCALTSAGVSRVDVERVQQLHLELEERLEVASLQLELMQTLQQMEDAKEDALLLDSGLFSLSELYNQFAQKWQCHALCLFMLQSSGYRDPSLIQQLWQECISYQVTSLSEDPVALVSRLSHLFQTIAGRLLLANHDWSYVPVDSVLSLFLAMIYPHWEGINAEQGHGWCQQQLQAIYQSNPVLGPILLEPVLQEMGTWFMTGVCNQSVLNTVQGWRFLVEEWLALIDWSLSQSLLSTATHKQSLDNVLGNLLERASALEECQDLIGKLRLIQQRIRSD